MPVGSLSHSIVLTPISGLATSLVSAPFIINNFVAAEIAQRVLPNWRWGYGMVHRISLHCVSDLTHAMIVCYPGSGGSISHHRSSDVGSIKSEEADEDQVFPSSGGEVSTFYLLATSAKASQEPRSRGLGCRRGDGFRRPASHRCFSGAHPSSPRPGAGCCTRMENAKHGKSLSLQSALGVSLTDIAGSDDRYWRDPVPHHDHL